MAWQTFFSSPDYWLTRLLLQRGLGLLYLVAFASAINQFRPLLGEHGLLPVPRFLSWVPFRASPSLFHAHYSDRFFQAVAYFGLLLAGLVTLGLPDLFSPWLSVVLWALLWLIYLSIVNVGQTFYAFGWESLLCEAGFLAIFLGSATTAPPILLIFLFRWLVFRLEFGAGLIKMRGDPCWRNLTCLYYHHETQPMPNPLSWFAHNLPRPLHRIEALGNHISQLIVPFFLFFPQPIAGIAALVIIATQLWLIFTGNFAWLNAITVVLAFSALDSAWLARVFPFSTPAHLPLIPIWQLIPVFLVTLLVVVLSWWPAKNLLSRHQQMNASFNPLHLVNTYGAFGSVTKLRHEIIIEGTSDPELTPTTTWQAYEFKGKPGSVTRLPRQFAPYHLRLDWLMWFAALSPSYARDWYIPFLTKLLQGDKPTLRLLRSNPFTENPPTYIRSRLYRYRFTTWSERHQTKAWWQRELVGEYYPPVALPPSKPSLNRSKVIANYRAITCKPARGVPVSASATRPWGESWYILPVAPPNRPGARRPRPRRTFPTFYARADAVALTSLEQLGAHLGHRVDSLDEYIDDQAKSILDEQAHYSRKQDRAQLEADAIEQITDFWTDQLAADFKVDVFASAAERDDRFDVNPRFSTATPLLEVIIDFEFTSDLLYPSSEIPSPAADTPNAALAFLTKGVRRRTGLFDRLQELGLLNPIYSTSTLYLNGDSLKEHLQPELAHRRLSSGRSRGREI